MLKGVFLRRSSLCAHPHFIQKAVFPNAEIFTSKKKALLWKYKGGSMILEFCALVNKFFNTLLYNFSCIGTGK